jgi:hypothetical protein
MFPQFFYDYSFYNSSPSQSGCTKFFHTRKNCKIIVEELWKNCRKILQTLDRQGIIVEILSKERAQNLSTILPQFFPAACMPDEGPQNLSTIFLQFIHNYSLLAVYHSKETKILRRFCGRIVEEFDACQIWGRIFLTAAD